MRTVIVTGGTRGIGLEICRKLLSTGYNVIATGRNPNDAKNKLSGDNISYKKLELDDSDSVSAFCDFLIDLPALHALVNNAGINKIEPFAKISSSNFNNVIDVNLNATFKLSQAFVRRQNAHKCEGKIVNIGSIWSVVSKAGRASYSASKSALEGLTRAISAEYAVKNILVNMVSPGFVNTELTAQSLSHQEITKILESVPINRFAEPAEIAELVEFLISARNTYISGQNIVIDGGFSNV